MRKVGNAYDGAVHLPARLWRQGRSRGWWQLGVILLVIAALLVQVFHLAQRRFVEGQELTQRGLWADAATRYTQAMRWNPLVPQYLRLLCDCGDSEPAGPDRSRNNRFASCNEFGSNERCVPLVTCVTSHEPTRGFLTEAEAEALLRRSLRLDGLNRPETYRVLAQLYRQQMRYDDAAACTGMRSHSTEVMI